MGVRIIKALLFGVYIRAPEVPKQELGAYPNRQGPLGTMKGTMRSYEALLGLIGVPRLLWEDHWSIRTSWVDVEVLGGSWIE